MDDPSNGIVQGNAVRTKAKTLHDNHVSEGPSEEPGVAGVAAAPGQDGHVGQAGMAGHGGFLCTKDPSETGLKGKGTHYTTRKKLT